MRPHSSINSGDLQLYVCFGGGMLFLLLMLLVEFRNSRICCDFFVVTSLDFSLLPRYYVAEIRCVRAVES